MKNGKHLVLDLDETLVHTFLPSDNYDEIAANLNTEQKKRVYLLKFADGSQLHGYVRPYAEEFLRIAFQEFDSVGVWSAGTKEYVEKIVQIVFKERYPAFVYSRDQCNTMRIKDEQAPCRFKPLDIIFDNFPDHNYKNTIIVDDRVDICALNCLNNIRIPEFSMNSSNYESYSRDPTLKTLSQWFQTPEFRSAPDVRQIKGRNPFRL